MRRGTGRPYRSFVFLLEKPHARTRAKRDPRGHPTHRNRLTYHA